MKKSKIKKILVVDDDPDILDAVQILLESEGYDVTTSTKGEIVKKFNGELPDLILLDVLLSGQDGREIARALKTQDETKNVPILMMSAHPTASNNIKEYLADDFVPKPFDCEYLMSKIRTYI